MENQVRVLVIGAHPDEPDIYAGGTAALFTSMGHKVKFLSLTNGSAGHYEQSGESLVNRRKQEAKEAAKRLGLEDYEVLDIPDGELVPSVAVRNEVIRCIREFRADLVITFHPEGGRHADNRYAGKVVSDAASFVALTPLTLPDVPCLEKSPLFVLMPDYSMRPYYSADIAIDIGSVVHEKFLACDAHATQFYEFAPWQGKALAEVPESQEGRKQFVLTNWAKFFEISEEMKPAIEKWYSPEQAAAVKYAEAFELARYSRKPSDEEIRALFPMLGSNA